MSSVDFTKLVHYQSQLPYSVEVKIGESKDGGFWVEILSLPGCFTQAENGEEVLVMVNDAIFTYFNIPEEYFSSLPRYFPNEKLKNKIQTWDKCAPLESPQQPITVTFFNQGAVR